jgi:diamine N-acetyltransferase
MILIKEVQPEELVIVQRIAQLTWPAAYGDILSQAQLDYMLGLMYSPAQLRTDQQNGHLFLQAISQGEPAGFCAVQHNYMGKPITRIHKIYVLPNQQGQNIGAAMMAKIESLARAAGSTRLSLNVNRHNSARHFYEKLGFTIVKEQVIEIGEGFVMDDYVMEKPL